MYHKLALLILLGSATTSFAQKSAPLSALWRDSTIVVNGDPTDWDQPFRYYDSKAKIQYCVVNDATNLYICLKTMDERGQMKILRPGMEVAISVSGKKKETSTVHFPLPNETKLEWIQDPAEPDQQHLERPDLKKLKMEYAIADKRMQLTGFKDIPAAQMPVENKYGVQIAIGWDKNDFLTYELKVPFSTFYKDAITAADTVSPININVKVNPFDVPQQIYNGTNTDPSQSNAGMRNQSYGNPQSNMANGGMPQSGSSQSMMPVAKVNEMAVSLQVQMKMKLAYK